MSTPQTARVGHVHLRVSDLDRAVAFYADILGFKVTQRYGDGAAFLAAGDYHHHIGLNAWESLGATPPPKGHTGLYQSAFVYPDRASLAVVLTRITTAGIPLDGAVYHGVSEAIYLRDPDENRVEIYVDKPRSEWPRHADGGLQMGNSRLDVAAILELAPTPS